MKFNDSQINALSAKLDASHVKTRNQAGRKLSYIEGWHAIAEANRIFGFDGWNRELVEVRQVCEHPRKIGEAQRDGWSVGYIARVRISVADVIRDGTGYGSGIDVDLGSAHESAIKEAETDAMKRALMTFGNPFGLALYDKTLENVEHAPPPVDMRERRANQIITEIRETKTQDELIALWKKVQGDIVAMPPDMQAAITGAKDGQKLALSRKAA